MSVSVVWRPGQETEMIMLDVRILDRRQSEGGLDLNAAPPFLSWADGLKEWACRGRRGPALYPMLERWRAKMGASRDYRKKFFKVLDGAHHRPI